MKNQTAKKDSADIRWLDDPEVFRVNQEEAHSDHVFYESEEAYREGKCALRQSLNGDWKFCYSKNAAGRPKEFYRTDYDRSSFDTIRVPGHIELAGYDKIHYDVPVGGACLPQTRLYRGADRDAGELFRG